MVAHCGGPGVPCPDEGFVLFASLVSLTCWLISVMVYWFICPRAVFFHVLHIEAELELTQSACSGFEQHAQEVKSASAAARHLVCVPLLHG